MKKTINTGKQNGGFTSGVFTSTWYCESGYNLHCHGWFSLFGRTQPYRVASLRAGPVGCISYNMYTVKGLCSFFKGRCPTEHLIYARELNVRVQLQCKLIVVVKNIWLCIYLVRRRKFNFRWRGPPDSSVSSLIIIIIIIIIQLVTRHMSMKTYYQICRNWIAGADEEGYQRRCDALYKYVLSCFLKESNDKEKSVRCLFVW